jgi:O-6-methylguanine DNA methyltransferase
MVKGYLKTEIGWLEVEVDQHKVSRIEFLDEDPDPIEESDNPLLLEALNQLNAYFKGQRSSFDLPLNFGGTEFQNKVWKALLEIPISKTSSYGQLASKLGDPNYVRAVGNANGKNPISIVVPCHRVIGSTGNLVGYAGGLWRKKWLLNFEGQLLSKQMELF